MRDAFREIRKVAQDACTRRVGMTAEVRDYYSIPPEGAFVGQHTGFVVIPGEMVVALIDAITRLGNMPNAHAGRFRNGFDPGSWTCMVCGDERPDRFIDVYKIPLDLGRRRGIDATINVRFCADRPACLEGAMQFDPVRGRLSIALAENAELHDVLVELHDETHGDPCPRVRCWVADFLIDDDEGE